MKMTSNPQFNDKTTGTEAAAALGANIKDRNVIITGISPTSIGASTALAIASQAPKNLILASRTASKVDAVAADITQKYPEVTVHKVALDLASLESVRAAVGKIEEVVDHVDVLVNNAGISHQHRDAITMPDNTVVDLQFFTNHLGPFLLTYLLLPKFRAAASTQSSRKGATRIVNLSSHGHKLSPVRFHDYQIHHYVYDGVPDSQKPPPNLPPGFLRLIDGYPGFIGYGQAKTANILHATELTRRLKKSSDVADNNILALSVHPGTIETQLSRDLDAEGWGMIKGTAPGGNWKTLDQGAATSVVAAFDPQLADLDVGGEVVGYMADCQLADDEVAEHARDAANAETLWKESERMLELRTGL